MSATALSRIPLHHPRRLVPRRPHRRRHLPHRDRAQAPRLPPRHGPRRSDAQLRRRGSHEPGARTADHRRHPADRVAGQLAAVALMPWQNSRPRSRKYGSAHAKARADAAKRHDPANPCVRCGHPLGPMGPGLHYDHNRAGTGYLGFSHGAPCPWCRKRCNVVAGAKEGRARQTATRLRW